MLLQITSPDGRFDSPGYPARDGTCFLVNTETNMIVDFQVDVSQAGNSNRMEKYGLEVLLKKLINLNVPITTSLTTDRHTQIRAFMNKEYLFISHQSDV